MTQYDDTNKGALWPNEKKESDRHPDFTGSANIAGTEFWVSAWRKGADAKPNAPVLRFAFKPKDEKPSKPKREEAPAFDDDDLGF